MAYGIYVNGWLFQSTRPRGARRGAAETSGWQVLVSIHAPARGATPVRSRQEKENNEFQSTRPRGARHREMQTAPEETLVSIHAPARGATLPSPI